MNFDTIAAISTAFGTAGISVIRISGEDAISEFNKIFKGKNLNKVKSHTLNYGHILDENGSIIDEVMVAVLKAPKSFTAEDTVEISTHGGILITQKVLERILDLNIRLAEPGEFSQRAYLNGRIDLVEAESIMDLIHAKSEQALKIANLGVQKETSRLIRNLRSKLLTIVAQIEVNIDYPEYDDAIIMSKEIIKPRTEELIQDINDLLKESQKNQLIREGVKTVIVGKPNVGKSSLLNALLDEEKAIVTDIEGTTRDTIEAYINISGVTLKLIDTAGIRNTEDFVEKIGVNRSIEALQDAELVLLVLDQSKALSEEDMRLLDLTRDKKRLIIGNKSDLKKVLSLEEVLQVSTITKSGLKELEKAILRLLSLEDIGQRDFNYLSNVRHIMKVKEAKESLINVLKSIELDMPVDVYAIDLTAAWRALGEILGENYQDDLLDELFSKFCLGK
ncbi:tRNA uridine-5-carboxymethylaminomethyl(34) synthesis GTPase MnmE [Peloplasma aerotolerans]|uniref:tRNA modification GTPase MnmE n=1 Tax=Peloplasma aerotolerans TaxID=3044389 RepID=A0AAW6U5J1_9MOLU|nr:tRNA uridine-5-carboxymethylaminomethyl(34) synthesis GTPase MnmE [Mariniplasma sp. M4Ah]MDI6452185.1 tRNA uridine-5-carboxymethylaminomethyl(34) synthesis GTPase MnmE [Mariniplasma sp. M4Ah]